MSGRLFLVYGGSGSGKSAWAERLLLSLAARSAGRAVYLATMSGQGEEARRRIARHRAMRAGHAAGAGCAFLTMERETDAGGADIQPGDFVLLEDLGNLLANEIWSPAGAGEDARERILAGIGSLLERAAVLVIVSSDVFGDGCAYDPETVAYIREMGALHQELARQAEQVVEVVCGIPIPCGGSAPMPRVTFCSCKK